MTISMYFKTKLGVFKLSRSFKNALPLSNLTLEDLNNLQFEFINILTDEYNLDYNHIKPIAEDEYKKLYEVDGDRINKIIESEEK